MTERHVLYLSYDGLTDPLGQSQVLPYLSALSEKNNQITVVTAEKKSNFLKRGAKIQDLPSFQNGSIVWEPLIYNKKPPIVSTLWDMWKIYQIAKRLFKRNHFDIIHCRSYIASIIGMLLAKKFSTKWIFDMRGFWADERVEGGIWSLNNPIYHLMYLFFKRQEKTMLNNADAVVVLTHSAAQEISKWDVKLKRESTVIPCCVDVELFKSRKIKKERGDDFKLVYLGSIGTWYLLDEMFDFFICLKEQKPKAIFQFITTENPKIIHKKAQAKGIPSSELSIISAERNEVPALLEDCDASVFFINPSFSKKGSSATKMGELLAMNLTVVTNSNVGDHAFLFENFICGHLVEKLSIPNYRAVVSKLLASKNNGEMIDYRETAVQYFNLADGVHKYNSIYEELAPK